MIVRYSVRKSDNTIVFMKPEVSISKKGEIIFTNNYTTKIRHMINVPGKTLGYIDTIIVDDKILMQSFFPLSGVIASAKRESGLNVSKGKSFGIDFMKDFVTLRNRETDLEESLRKILDLYTNLGCIYDSSVCALEIAKARALLGDIHPSRIPTHKEKWREQRHREYFDMKLKCFGINSIAATSLRGMSGLLINIKEAEVEYIINELYEIFGPDMLIDYIKNG